MNRTLVRISHECLINCDLDLYFDLLNFTQRITDFYGVGALKITQDVAFQDTELNIGCLLSLLIRMIVRKCDTTEVNLTDGTNGMNMKVAKAFSGPTAKRHKKSAPLQHGDAPTLLNQHRLANFLAESDPYTLQVYLQNCLTFLKALSASYMTYYLRADVKASLEMNLVNFMSVSSLKFSSSPLDQEIMSSIV